MEIFDLMNLKAEGYENRNVNIYKSEGRCFWYYF